MRVLCIWLPNWPSQRIAAMKRQAEPASQSAVPPLLLFARDARRGQLIAAANSTARKLGVLPAMTLSSATALCPTAELIEHDSQADIEQLCSLAEATQCFSPIAGIEQIDKEPWAGRSLHQPQAILLDATGIAPLFGGEQQLAQAIHTWFADQCFLVSIGIASSVGTAWALANYSQRSQVATSLSDIELRSATAHAQPIITILAPDEPVGIAMFPLPIESLRLDQATVAKLHRIGVRKVGQLMELPREGLVSRLGEGLIQRIDQTIHNRQEPIVGMHASPELAIEDSLEHPTPLRETIDEKIGEQIVRLVHVLDSMGHGVIRLVCRIEMECNAIAVETIMDTETDSSDSTHPTASANREVRVFQIGLYQPSNEPEHLLWLLRGQLDSQFEKTTRKRRQASYWAKTIGIQATLTAPIVWQQSSLFERDSVSHRVAIAKLIDNLSSRLGRNSVVAPTLHRDPQPELAYTWRPLTGWRKDGVIQDTKKKLTRAPKRNFAIESGVAPVASEAWRRPTRLLQPPKQIEIEMDFKGVPATIQIRNARIAIEQALGPERVDSGWWQGMTQQRDYYRIVLGDGTWLWVYHNRRDRQWYLQGEFD
jgi:protein ImuB